MSSDISACKLLGVGVVVLGSIAITTTLAGHAIQYASQHPAVLVPFAALGAYRLASECMVKSSKSIPNPSRRRPPSGGGRGEELSSEGFGRREELSKEGTIGIPESILTGICGIENRDNSCVLASFLCTFIATNKLDEMFLTDAFGDNKETTDLRELLRNIVNDLRSEAQFVSGKKLLKFRNKLVSIDSGVGRTYRRMRENTSYLSVNDVVDSLRDKFRLRPDEFIKMSYDKADTVAGIVTNYLERESSSDWSKKQTFLVSISKNKCRISEDKEMHILDNKFELTSIIFNPTRRHTAANVFKNDKCYYFDSNEPSVIEVVKPDTVKDAYLLYTRK